MSISRKSLTLRDAQKLTLPTNFSTLIKPVGSRCNMRCAYCYYLDKALLYPEASHREVMSKETLRKYIADYISTIDAPTVNFCWHGGEPLMAGLDFFAEAVYYQNKYANGKEITNAVQTNGLLINRAWAKFFKANNFLVGVSLDGPQDIHDAYRVDGGGRGTFNKVLSAIEILKQEAVEFNTLSVVNNLCKDRGVEIYNFFKSIGSRYMQFLPAVEFIDDQHIDSLGGRGRILSPEHSTSGHISPWSTTAYDFGKFMCDIFEEWRKQDIGEYYVQLFDVTLANWYEVPCGLCAYSKSCGDGLAIEHNGDVYSCDHFVYPEYKLGNLNDTKLRDMYRSREQFEFGVSKRNGLSDSCLNCQYYHLCSGGCPKHRFRDSKDELSKNYLCEGYKLFFSHSAPYMQRMCELLRCEMSPAMIMNENIQNLSL